MHADCRFGKVCRWTIWHVVGGSFHHDGISGATFDGMDRIGWLGRRLAYNLECGLQKLRHLWGGDLGGGKLGIGVKREKGGEEVLGREGGRGKGGGVWEGGGGGGGVLGYWGIGVLGSWGIGKRGEGRFGKRRANASCAGRKRSDCTY